MTSRKHNIYEWYILNFEEKDLKFNRSKCAIVSMWDIFIELITFKKISNNNYCPYCCKKVDSISYYDSPIFTYGCNNCRIKKENK